MEETSDERRGGASVLLRKRDLENKQFANVDRSVSATALSRLPYNVAVHRSPIHNWGLFTTRAVPKDAMVVEYKGQASRDIAEMYPRYRRDVAEMYPRYRRGTAEIH